MNADPQSDWLDVRQAAACAGRDPETIRRWIRTDRVGAARMGGRWMVKREDVEAVAGRAGRPMTLAEWADKNLARLAEAPRGKWRSSANLVLEERRRREEKAFDDYVRRQERRS